MRFPQEIIDAIIDYVGADCAEDFIVGRPFQSINENERTELKSLALVSRACNHRARSHLFARCNVVNSDFGTFERFRQCPGAILKYTRALIIRRSENPISILSRFTSSPLVSIRFHLMQIPEELPKSLKSLFPNVRRVAVVASTLSAVAVLNLIGILEHMSELRLERCHCIDLGGDDSLPTLPPLQGRLILYEPRSPHFAITSLLSRIPLPLRSLCYKQIGLPSENRFIGSCAGSLENLELGIVASLANSGCALDLGPCVNLRQIICFITSDHGGDAITSLSGLLSTLREHKLSNIRLVVVSSPPSPGSGPREYDLRELESWERLDRVLCKLGGQAQRQGEILTFQIPSVATSTKQALAGLLPRFSETGVCEWVAR